MPLGWASLAVGAYTAYDAHKSSSKALKGGDPFGGYRAYYGDQLMQLMQNPSSERGQPGYQFRFDQGSEAVTRQMAAKGMLGSGNMGAALVEYGQNYADTFYQKDREFLAGLAGANIAPNAGAGVQAAQNDFSNYGDILASLAYQTSRSGGGWNSGSTGGVGAGGGGMSSGYGGGYGGSLVTGRNGGAMNA